MYYSIVKRGNPLDSKAEALYYAQPVWGSEIGLKTISQQISKYSTLTPADISAVLESFIELLPLWLKEGHSVRLGNLGIMRITFRSAGHQSEEDVSAGDIKNARAVFRGSNDFKSEIADISFEKIKTSASQTSSENEAESSSD